MNKQYNWQTDEHYYSPEEYPLLSVSPNRMYTMMLVPRRPSPEYQFVKMKGKEPIFEILKTAKVMGLNELLKHNILKDYQYFNLPTKEIREYPCVVMHDKIKKRISRRNYMDWNLAIHEYKETVKQLGLIEISPADNQEDNTLTETTSSLNLPSIPIKIKWWKKAWIWIKRLFKKLTNYD